jgi:5-methylcytosine-specific restriction enzyme A
MSFFNQDMTVDYFAEEVPERYGEEKRKTISVNVFERNSINSKKCMEHLLEHYSVGCQVCKLNHEGLDGEVGKDFTHVHHVK